MFSRYKTSFETTTVVVADIKQKKDIKQSTSACAFVTNIDPDRQNTMCMRVVEVVEEVRVRNSESCVV